MVSDLKVLALIPARGGSKGVPRKNIRPLCGKPLLLWSLEAARASRYLDRVVLSSEDPEIVETARQAGLEVPFLRPPELARDDTPGVEPVLHALDLLPGYDLVVLLQPTSPFRSGGDIDRCIERLVESGAPCAVSVTRPEKSPYWMYTMGPESRLAPLLPTPEGFSRRQDLPEVYALNGAVYVARTEWLRATRSFLTPETVGCVMTREHSVDIDSEEDFALCEFRLSRG